MEPQIRVSHGELIDKITILRIKSERIRDEVKLANVRRELTILEATWSKCAQSSAPLDAIVASLQATNAELWEIEDRLRIKEARQEFDETFIQLARSVYFTNDRRAALKREINVLLESSLVEEKEYVDYQS
ncbi:MAG: DUF6165 family protein [Gammaproteobacteria bacterium]